MTFGSFSPSLCSISFCLGCGCTGGSLSSLIGSCSSSCRGCALRLLGSSSRPLSSNLMATCSIRPILGSDLAGLSFRCSYFGPVTRHRHTIEVSFVGSIIQDITIFHRIGNMDNTSPTGIKVTIYIRTNCVHSHVLCFFSNVQNLNLGRV